MDISFFILGINFINVISVGEVLVRVFIWLSIREFISEKDFMCVTCVGKILFIM